MSHAELLAISARANARDRCGELCQESSVPLWLHRGRERAELGLHFETRDPPRDQRLLEYVADDLPFLKIVVGNGLEAEPWDKGWTRVYLTLPLTRLDSGAQADLAMAFGDLIETLEPFRREAVDATVDPNL